MMISQKLVRTEGRASIELAQFTRIDLIPQEKFHNVVKAIKIASYEWIVWQFVGIRNPV